MRLRYALFFAFSLAPFAAFSTPLPQNLPTPPEQSGVPFLCIPQPPVATLYDPTSSWRPIRTAAENPSGQVPNGNFPTFACSCSAKVWSCDYTYQQEQIEPYQCPSGRTPWGGDCSRAGGHYIADFIYPENLRVELAHDVVLPQYTWDGGNNATECASFCNSLAFGTSRVITVIHEDGTEELIEEQVSSGLGDAVAATVCPPVSAGPFFFTGPFRASARCLADDTPGAGGVIIGGQTTVQPAAAAGGDGGPLGAAAPMATAISGPTGASGSTGSPMADFGSAGSISAMGATGNTGFAG